ncbi:replication-related protein [Leptolyngbya sp. Heron Island J]|uniref:replication-related protein n=1 Tax=Leptolyngbya sp. Heron Island J TaxID=1385935 RepID=UPI0003B9A654|nr:replication-related protein [Leptolyngbya sp. Heron Island J]ESA37145.1 replication-related protein [Leptolyngbya sp. Heron Island J]
MTAATYASLRSTYIQEENDRFLGLWPHRFDYLFSAHPDPGSKPQWQTESRHPLSDRLLQQGSYLYGVRFGQTTNYALIDIDRGSPYHPRRDALAITRLSETLEELGLVQHLTVTSSDSGGLHIYFPFEISLPSWQVGLAITTLVENKGFKVLPGWLEVFPNAKSYNPGEQTLYNGHRLPLQQGGYLLNEDLEPVSGCRHRFIEAWSTATEHNDINLPQLAAIISQAKRRTYNVSSKAEKFLNDLNAEIAVGWTGRKQTNRLLGRITMRSYIFGHLLDAPAPLQGKALEAHIKQTVLSLPGYELWCGHKEDIDKRIAAWARSIENSSDYFPYGHNSVSKEPPKPEGPSWNERQQQAARERISNAVQAFIDNDTWPDSISERFDLLLEQGIGGSTLYKDEHKSLWHPRFIPTTDQRLSTPSVGDEHPPDPPTSQGQVTALEAPSQSAQAYCVRDSKKPEDKGFGSFETGKNNSLGRKKQQDSNSPVPQQLWLEIHRSIEAGRTSQAATQTAQVDTYQEEVEAAHIANLKEWLASDDPILVAEARAQLRRREGEYGSG